jgi:hypothetical protein
MDKRTALAPSLGLLPGIVGYGDPFIKQKGDITFLLLFIYFNRNSSVFDLN